MPALPRIITQGAALLACKSARRIHMTAATGMPYKDDTDRESLKPKEQEYAKTGGGDGDAAKTDVAFNPNKTSPEAEKNAGGDTLSGSPANKDLSKAKKQEGKASGQQKDKASGGGGRK